MNLFLDRLIEEKLLITEEHFLLTSGRHSDSYFFKERLHLSINTLTEAIGEMNRMILTGEVPKCSAVVGPAVGGIVLASPIAIYHNFLLTYTEKDENHHFVLRQAFKDALKGEIVLVIDDTITTGGSILGTIDAVQECGATVCGVLCIWNRTGFTCDVPVISMIDMQYPDWSAEECPMCKKGIVLRNPKEIGVEDTVINALNEPRPVPEE